MNVRNKMFLSSALVVLCGVLPVNAMLNSGKSDSPKYSSESSCFVSPVSLLSLDSSAKDVPKVPCGFHDVFGMGSSEELSLYLKKN